MWADIQSERVLDLKGVTPTCTKCGGTVRPDVVLYEEGLKSQVIEKAVRAIASADMLIIGGTSLVVYPAAGCFNTLGETNWF